MRTGEHLEALASASWDECEPVWSSQLKLASVGTEPQHCRKSHSDDGIIGARNDVIK